MVNDPAELLGQLFPRAMLNLDSPPPGMAVGPMKAIFTAVGNVVKHYSADMLLLKAQMSVQLAAGPYLDLHGVLYSVPRIPNEDDDPYRARILQAVNVGRLTLIAIQHVVQNYLTSIAAPGTTPPTVTTYDLQSDPAQCAADGTYVDEGGTTTPIVILDFVIDINYQISADDAFFLDWSYLDQNAYLESEAAVLETDPGDPNLVSVVRRNKATGTHPVYRVHATIS
jgi:hypothetical protein